MPDSPSSTPSRSFITHLHWVVLARDLGSLVVGLILIPIALVAGMLTFGTDAGAAVIMRYLPLAGSLWMMGVWMLAAIVWTRYYLSIWVITDEFLIYINQASIFERSVAAWRTDTIVAASALSDDALETLLGYGSVFVRTPEAGESEYIVAETIPRPQTLADAIIAHIPVPVDAQAEIAKVVEQQEELLHSISHEMKGHLARSQATFASIVQGDFGPVPEDVKRIAEGALADTREGVDTVMDILNSANLKKGTLAFDKAPFDLIEAVRECISTLQADADKKNLRVDFNAPQEPITIEGDRNKLIHHVFRNLIDNAIRYTPQGAIDITITTDDTSAMLAVADTGVGIAPEDMARLFTEGGKGSESSKVNPASTGYGLFVARQIVEAHGGQIWAQSDGTGTGSTFYVRLPIVQA